MIEDNLYRIHVVTFLRKAVSLKNVIIIILLRRWATHLSIHSQLHTAIFNIHSWSLVVVVYLIEEFGRHASAIFVINCSLPIR